MRKPKISEKFSVLISICDDEKKEDLDEYLTRKRLKNGLMFIGKGTAESDIADIFGFGLSDKIITALLVQESRQDKVAKDLSDFLGIEEDSFGLVMLLETSSASTVVLDKLGIQVLQNSRN